jgi:hypothetical protein
MADGPVGNTQIGGDPRDRQAGRHEINPLLQTWSG